MLRDDIRSALRALRAKPGFAALIVACLAIGIGANIAMFSIANVLFLQPAPGVRKADGLLHLYVIRRSGEVQTPDGGGFSYPDLADLRRAGPTFAGVAGWHRATFTVGHGSDAESVEGENASADYFRVLGAHTARGRFFTPDEDSVPGLRPAVVIGYRYWQSHFQGRDVIGQTLTVNDQPSTIVGIAERGFQGAGLGREDIWVPLVGVEPIYHFDLLQNRNMTWVNVIARRAPGVSEARAMTVATAALTGGAAADPKMEQHPQVVGKAWFDGIGFDAPPHGTLILWLFGAVGFVLAIACANVANLLLVRSVQRRRELAVRLSLGISRSRLARQMLIESVILALSGAAAGLLIAWSSTTTWSIPGLGPQPNPWDPNVLAFTIGLALVTAIVFGVWPAFTATKTDLSVLLKNGAPSASRTGSRGRAALIALQAALSLIVLAGSGLFIRTLQKMATVNLGIDTDHVVLVNAKLPPLTDSAGREASHARVIAQLATLPGVRAVSIEDEARYRGILAIDVWRPGPDSLPQEAQTHFPIVNFVGPSYAEAFGTPILSGRDITSDDRVRTLPVTVVSQRMAQVFWPGKNPIGQCLMVSVDQYPPPHCAYVVGVVADVMMGFDEGPTLFYYVPRTQLSLAFQPMVIVRTSGPARAALQTIRAAVIQAAPEVTYVGVNTPRMLLADRFAPAQLGALLFTIFGIAALGLTAIGLYGVVAYLVAQRAREVGIRMALGSTALAAMALMARQGAKPVAIGLVVGLAGAVGVTRFLQHLLYNVSPTDGPSFAAAAGVLGLVAAVACIVPARKAAKVDPVVALRSE